MSAVSQSVSMDGEKDRRGRKQEQQSGDMTGRGRGAILKGYPQSATLAKGFTQCCLFSVSG